MCRCVAWRAPRDPTGPVCLHPSPNPHHPPYRPHIHLLLPFRRPLFIRSPGIPGETWPHASSHGPNNGGYTRAPSLLFARSCFDEVGARPHNTRDLFLAKHFLLVLLDYSPLCFWRLSPSLGVIRGFLCILLERCSPGADYLYLLLDPAGLQNEGTVYTQSNSILSGFRLVYLLEPSTLDFYETRFILLSPPPPFRRLDIRIHFSSLLLATPLLTVASATVKCILHVRPVRDASRRSFSSPPVAVRFSPVPFTPFFLHPPRLVS